MGSDEGRVCVRTRGSVLHTPCESGVCVSLMCVRSGVAWWVTVEMCVRSSLKLLLVNFKIIEFDMIFYD